MSDSPVHLSTTNGIVELESCEDTATLGDLAKAIAIAREIAGGKLSRCAGCGECCHQPIPVLGTDMARLAAVTGLPEKEMYTRVLIWPERRVDAAERRAAIDGLMRDMSMTEAQAASTYDFNNGEPVIMARGADGACRFLADGRCSIYEHRPLSCRIFLCAMGERLSVLQEGIVGHGTWHACARAGWIDPRELGTNPFLGTDRWETIPVAAFAPVNPADPEDLFFYF